MDYYGKRYITKNLDLYEYVLKDEYTEWIDNFFNRISNTSECDAFSLAKNLNFLDNLNLDTIITLLEDYLNSTKISDKIHDYYMYEEENTRVIKYNDITLKFIIEKWDFGYNHPGTDGCFKVRAIYLCNTEKLEEPVIDVKELQSYARNHEKIHLIEIMRAIRKLKHYKVNDEEIMEDLTVAENYLKKGR